MRYRKLDANADYSFGHGRADFWQDVPDAVAQLVVTRFAHVAGRMVARYRRRHALQNRGARQIHSGTRDPVLRFRALDTPGVTELVSYSSDLNRETRFFGVVMTIDTVYGRIAIRGPI